MFFYNEQDENANQIGDPYFSNVSLLLKMDNDFSDSSTYAHTINVNGNATISSAQSKYGGASGYFDGNGDWLTFTGTTTGAEDFTTEAWVNLSSLKDYQVIFDNRATGATSTGYAFGVDANGRPYIYTSGNFQILSTITISINTWNHLAVVRSGSVVTIYVNGISGGSYTSTANFSDTNNGIGVAPTYIITSQFFGYIDDLRITKGVARYTANFVPPDSLPTS